MVVTNFNKEEELIYREAIKHFGKKYLYIEKDAYDINGRKIESAYALRSSVNADLSEFWKIFKKIKSTKWCIIRDKHLDNTIDYLGWSTLDRYHWTSREMMEEIIHINNTPEHPFLFNSKKEADNFLKSKWISQIGISMKWPEPYNIQEDNDMMNYDDQNDMKNKISIGTLKMDDTKVSLNQKSNITLACLCMICNESISLTELENEIIKSEKHSIYKICDKCKKAVLKMREKDETPNEKMNDTLKTEKSPYEKIIATVKIDLSLKENTIKFPHWITSELKESSLILSYPVSNTNQVLMLSNINIIEIRHDFGSNDIIVSSDIAQKLGVDYIMDTVLIII